jgi:hypothetical protein
MDLTSLVRANVPVRLDACHAEGNCEASCVSGPGASNTVGLTRSSDGNGSSRNCATLAILHWGDTVRPDATSSKLNGKSPHPRLATWMQD